jgi:predicted RNA-binding Zn-ribbon protein involved in translation (DUF1610 family)
MGVEPPSRSTADVFDPQACPTCGKETLLKTETLVLTQVRFCVTCGLVLLPDARTLSG